MTVANRCTGCPFDYDTLDRVELRAQVDQGAWVPCKRTVAPARDARVHGRIAAWSQEEECRGAREWRARFLNERRRKAA